MPLYGAAEKEAWLAAGVATQAAGDEFALYDGIPVPVNAGDPAPGMELSGDGYHRVAAEVGGTEWTVADEEATATLDFGPATDAWSRTGSWWARLDALGNVRCFGLCPQSVTVEQAQDVPVLLVLSWNDPFEVEE